MDIFLQQIVNGLVLGSVYALVALGYTMVYGILGLINFAHGEVVMVGALTSLSVIELLLSANLGIPAPLIGVVALTVALAVCTTLGFSIERIAYRPLRRAPRLAPLITAIGVSILLQTLAMLIWGRRYHTVPTIIAATPHHFAGATITSVQILIIVVSASIMAGLLGLVHFTRLGRAMRATAENPVVAGLMGVNINRIISATFIIGSALAAVAGVLVSSNYGIAHYYMGFLLGLKAFTAAVLGGIGNLAGAMLGGLLLGLIESLGAGYIGDLTGGFLGSNYQDVFAFVVLILVLVFRPTGLLGAAGGGARVTTAWSKFLGLARQHPGAKWIGYAFIIIALAVLPFALEASIGRTWVRIVDLALLYTMLALGLNIVVGFAGLLDLGYIAFYAVGAYMYALLASPHFGIHLPWWILLPMGAAVAAFFGVVLGAPTLRLRGDYLAIVTLGFGEIIRIFLNNLNAPYNITNGPQGVNRIDAVSIDGVSFGTSNQILGISFPGTHLHYYLFVLLTALIVFVCIRLEDSRIGRAWVAIREDEIAAQSMGINTRNIKLLAFAMGATFGGVAGGLFSSLQGFVSPESFQLWESIMVLCMVVLGGMGHVAGVVLGALLLAIFPEVLRHTASPVQQQLFGKVILDPESLRMLLFGLALILVMLLRPAGLWPSPTRRRELTSARAPGTV